MSSSARPRRLPNPYLVAAGILAAGVLGMEQQLELEPPAVPPAEEQTGHEPLPVDMREALGELEASEPIREVLGEDFVTAYTTMRRYELQRFEDHVTDWEFAEYVELF